MPVIDPRSPSCKKRVLPAAGGPHPHFFLWYKSPFSMRSSSQWDQYASISSPYLVASAIVKRFVPRTEQSPLLQSCAQQRICEMALLFSWRSCKPLSVRLHVTLSSSGPSMFNDGHQSLERFLQGLGPWANSERFLSFTWLPVGEFLFRHPRESVSVSVVLPNELLDTRNLTSAVTCEMFAHLSFAGKASEG